VVDTKLQFALQNVATSSHLLVAEHLDTCTAGIGVALRCVKMRVNVSARKQMLLHGISCMAFCPICMDSPCFYHFSSSCRIVPEQECDSVGHMFVFVFVLDRCNIAIITETPESFCYPV